MVFIRGPAGIWIGPAWPTRDGTMLPVMNRPGFGGSAGRLCAGRLSTTSALAVHRPWQALADRGLLGRSATFGPLIGRRSRTGSDRRDGIAVAIAASGQLFRRPRVAADHPAVRRDAWLAAPTHMASACSASPPFLPAGRMVLRRPRRAGAPRRPETRPAGRPAPAVRAGPRHLRRAALKACLSWYALSAVLGVRHVAARGPYSRPNCAGLGPGQARGGRGMLSVMARLAASSSRPWPRAGSPDCIRGRPTPHLLCSARLLQGLSRCCYICRSTGWCVVALSSYSALFGL